MMSTRPRSMDELHRAARYKFDALPDLHSLICGVQDLLQEAKIYEGEHDAETAYILLYRCHE